jgi:UDPglucose 6-dehydrogenase
MKISIIDTGYIGLVTGVCLEDFGNNIICVGNDK